MTPRGATASGTWRYIQKRGKATTWTGLLEFAQGFPALTQQLAEITALINCLAGEETMLERISVDLRCARSLGSAMHSAAQLSRYSRIAAGGLLDRVIPSMHFAVGIPRTAMIIFGFAPRSFGRI